LLLAIDGPFESSAFEARKAVSRKCQPLKATSVRRRR
jgi:hypothetical protein